MDGLKIILLLFIAIGFIIGVYGLYKKSILTIISGITFLLIPIVVFLKLPFFFFFLPPLAFVFTNHSRE